MKKVWDYCLNDAGILLDGGSSYSITTVSFFAAGIVKDRNRKGQLSLVKVRLQKGAYTAVIMCKGFHISGTKVKGFSCGFVFLFVCFLKYW